MKQGLKEGLTETIEVQVTPEMFAQFEGEIIHRVYSTVTMIYHMEWVSRKIILPFLDKHEEGMGGAVSAKHIAPSPEGSVLTITAVLSEVKDNIITTDVSVTNGTKMIGIGKVKQVILPKSKITHLFE